MNQAAGLTFITHNQDLGDIPISLLKMAKNGLLVIVKFFLSVSHYQVIRDTNAPLTELMFPFQI